jgi:hypothetical protein
MVDEVVGKVNELAGPEPGKGRGEESSGDAGRHIHQIGPCNP